MQKNVEDALAKLDALAKRQEDLANQQRNPQQSFQERWQQEMLRREAEQLQRQMEQQLAQNSQGQQGGPAAEWKTELKRTVFGTVWIAVVAVWFAAERFIAGWVAVSEWFSVKTAAVRQAEFGAICQTSGSSRH